MDFNQYRNLFPVTANAIYLNHASISPFSVKVQQAIQSFVEKRTGGMADLLPEMVNEINLLKTNVSRLITTQTDRIAIIKNTSEGMNWLAQGLSWKPGDQILLADCEFPANVYPFLNLERKGVEVKFLSANDGAVTPQLIENNITSRTKLISLSFVQFTNGYRADLATIGNICKANDIIFAVDGIQGVGALPLNVENCSIDFLSNGGHKWLMGPAGCGFMYLSKKIEEKLTPPFIGWLSVKNSWDFSDYQLDLKENAEKYEIGTANFMGIYGARASTDLLLSVSPVKILPHLIELGDYMIEGLRELEIMPASIVESHFRSGILTFMGAQTEELFSYLQKNRIYVSLRGGGLRISPHFYNNRDDIDGLLECCREFFSTRKL
jgi:cysteine desulfurase/selenocysteine lyase